VQPIREIIIALKKVLNINNMREIKFRAWDKKEKRMLKNIEEFSPEDFFGSFYSILKNYDEFVVMQYTGIKDKNGKEIYERDILRYTRKNWRCPGHPNHNTDLVERVEIYWDEERNAMSNRIFDFERLKINQNQQPYSSSGYFGSGLSDDRADENIIEIIGNIYENPELLK
jgi:uncharacterized phage protein (TIGR01671 family)